MIRVLVSACLLGAKVRYHGGDAASAHPSLRRWFEEGRLVSVCPETDGGLPTPRPPAEIIGSGGGGGVVSRLAVVRNSNGVDVTAAFINGAKRALEVARAGGILDRHSQGPQSVVRQHFGVRRDIHADAHQRSRRHNGIAQGVGDSSVQRGPD